MIVWREYFKCNKMKTTNSIFEESWYLDAVAPGQWKELKVEQDGIMIARWPIVVSGKQMKLPRYVQTIGIWMNPEHVKTIADEEEIYLKLIEQLPKVKRVEWGLAPENQFYLPFVWQGFNLSVGASYIIEDLSDMDTVYQNMSEMIRRNIKQASKKVTVDESDDIEQLISMSLETYRKQGRAYIVRPDSLRRLFKAAKEKKACSLLAAKDAEGRVHSMTLFVYDEKRCYYLVGASNSELNAKSKANTLLMWEGIKIAAQQSKVFDFEGSTIQGIGTFFRRFGSKFTYHFTISKNDLVGDMFHVLKPRIKKLLGHKK